MNPARLTTLAALAAVLAGCAYTFIPLVPDPIPIEQHLTADAATTLERDGDALVLHASIRNITAEGYLSVYLYRDDTKIAEDSKLITPTDTTAEFRFQPAQVGTYRALLFWNGRTIRQLEYTLNP